MDDFSPDLWCGLKWWWNLVVVNNNNKEDDICRFQKLLVLSCLHSSQYSLDRMDTR